MTICFPYFHKCDRYKTEVHRLKITSSFAFEPELRKFIVLTILHGTYDISHRMIHIFVELYVNIVVQGRTSSISLSNAIQKSFYLIVYASVSSRHNFAAYKIHCRLKELGQNALIFDDARLFMQSFILKS